jgi:hypothetical protein
MVSARSASYGSLAEAQTRFTPDILLGDTMKLPLMTAALVATLAAAPVFAQSPAPAPAPAPAAPAATAPAATAPAGDSMSSPAPKKTTHHKSHSSHHHAKKAASTDAAPAADAPK